MGEIEKRRERNRAYYQRTAETRRAKARAWYKANAEKKKADAKSYRERQVELKRAREGIPAPTRPAPEACECCGATKTQRRAGHSLCGDHDHTTGKFRGWLCHPCNLGIGNLGDTVAGLEKGIAYLRRAE